MWLNFLRCWGQWGGSLGAKGHLLQYVRLSYPVSTLARQVWGETRVIVLAHAFFYIAFQLWTVLPVLHLLRSTVGIKLFAHWARIFRHDMFCWLFNLHLRRGERRWNRQVPNAPWTHGHRQRLIPEEPLISVQFMVTKYLITVFRRH